MFTVLSRTKILFFKMCRLNAIITILTIDNQLIPSQLLLIINWRTYSKKEIYYYSKIKTTMMLNQYSSKSWNMTLEMLMHLIQLLIA